MRNFFTFDGVPSTEYGVYISGHDTFDSPSRAYEYFSVPGKNGDNIGPERRLQNVELVYDAFVYRAFATNIQGLRNFLLSRIGYKRLKDTYHPDEFRLAVFDSALDISTTSDNRAGSFQLHFNCTPQRYLESGEIVREITGDTVIENPTLFDAKPWLRIYGTGTVGIGGYSITINSADGYTDIDCEIMEAYKGGVSCNGNITLNGVNFPVLSPGPNGITLSTGISRVEIKPRWYIV